MNAWLLFLPGWPATSIGRLDLLQRCWSAHEALLVILAIDRRETYRFLNSLIDSSVTRKALGVGLDLSHSNSTNRRTDLVLQSSWRAASAMVLVSPWARARSSSAKRWNPSYDTSSPATVPSTSPTTRQLSRRHGSHDVCLGLDGSMPSTRRVQLARSRLPAIFHFGDPYIIQLVTSPLPLDSLESVDYQTFSCNILSPNGLHLTAFTATLTGHVFPLASPFLERRRQAGLYS